ncbi:PAS domain-containing sensor histidine kinase [Halorubrum tibetense]|uniref:histidine kinase n=1 Tax=Halorubrum tibetense TaxID=175631 RepID=A0ABD5SCC7_9EURY
MPPQTDPRPGVAYRRPDGDPTRLRIESAGDSELPVSELPRTDWLDAVHPDDRGRLREGLGSETVDVAYRVDADDDFAWIQERGRTVDGDLVGYLFPACDRVRRQRQLEQQRERLDEFASVVSHDLRNPLSVAVGNLELAREFDGQAAETRLDRVNDALDRMDALISDLLSLAREGRSVEATAETDLRPVVRRAWKTVGVPDAELAVSEPLPRIECDRDRLRQALENLLLNSVEHGSTSNRTQSGDSVEHGSTSSRAEPDDSVEHGSTSNRTQSGDSVEHGSTSNRSRTDAHEAVEDDLVRTVETDPFGGSDPATDEEGGDHGVRVVIGATDEGFYVADDGPGIPPEERETVFEPGHTTDEDGTGFGLAIVERIVEAHGWSISIAESRAGGARFEITDVDTVDTSGPPTGGDAATARSERSSAE